MYRPDFGNIKNRKIFFTCVEFRHIYFVRIGAWPKFASGKIRVN